MQENFDLETESGSFPPLSDTPSNNHTLATAPPPNPSEEGASNLADIVKGKRLNSGPALMNGNGVPSGLPNGLTDRLSSKVLSAPPKVQPPPHSPTMSQAVQPPRAQQKPESKVCGGVGGVGYIYGASMINEHRCLKMLYIMG